MVSSDEDDNMGTDMDSDSDNHSQYQLNWADTVDNDAVTNPSRHGDV